MNNTFKELEIAHDEVFLSHAVFYLTAFKNGISEQELQDLITLKEFSYELLDSQLRRQESLLESWLKFRNDLKESLLESWLKLRNDYKRISDRKRNKQLKNHFMV